MSNILAITNQPQHLLQSVWLHRPNVAARLHKWGWAVFAQGESLCMNKQGDWDFTPQASQIDNTWIEDHYFESLALAIVVATNYIPELPRKSPVLDLLFAINEILLNAELDAGGSPDNTPMLFVTSTMRSWLRQDKIFGFTADKANSLATQ